MVTPRRALADTSIFIGMEAKRFDVSQFDEFEWGISVVTLGELRLGVLQAADAEAVSRRLSTYQLAQRFEALATDDAVSEAWAFWFRGSARPARKYPSMTVGSRRLRLRTEFLSSLKTLTARQCPV